ncbi:MAG: hypothetical protein AB8B71_16085 [Paracoccaceae bacterium]
MAGRVLDLGKRGDIGTAGDTAYAELGYDANLTLGAEICSGLRVGLAADFAANGAAGVELAEFFEAVAELEAGASVKAEIVAQASPDVSGTFGLYLSAAAAAQAYVRARLSAGLKIGELVNNTLSDDGKTDLEARLLLALLDKISLEYGVEASMQVAVAASANLAVRFNLRPQGQDQAGFDIRVGAGAGFIYGKDFAVFLRGRLPSLPDYIDEAVEIIGRDITDRFEGPLGPMVVATIIAAGGVISLALDIKDKDVPNQARELLYGLSRDILSILVDETTRHALSKAEATLPDPSLLAPDFETRLIAAMGRDPINLSEVLALLSEIVDTIAAPMPGDDEPAISRVSATLHALLYVVKPDDPAFTQALPAHVLRQVQLPAGRDQFANIAEASTLLDNGYFASLMRDLPAPLDVFATTFLDMLAHEGIGLADVLSDNTLSQTDRRRIAISLATKLLEDCITPLVEDLLTDTRLPPVLVDILRSLLYGPSKVLIPILIEIAAETDRRRLKELREELADSAARMSAVMLVSQATELAQTVIIKEFSDLDLRINQARAQINAPGSEFAEQLVDPMLKALSRALPSIDITRTPQRAEMVSITVSLANDLLDAAQEAFGVDTWSPQRIQRICGALVKVTAGVEGGRINWESSSAPTLRATFAELNDCPAIVPDTRATLEELSQDLKDIALLQARVFARHVPGIFARHLPDLAKVTVVAVVEEMLDEIVRRANALADRTRSELDDLADQLMALEGQIDDAVQAIDEAIEDLRQAVIDWAEGRIDDITANLNFTDPRLAHVIADAVLTFFNRPGVILDGSDLVQLAKEEMRSLKNDLRARLNGPAFDDMTTKAQNTRGTILPDFVSLVENVADKLLTSQEQAVLEALPVNGAVSKVIAAQTLSGSVRDASRAVGNTCAEMTALRMQHASRTGRSSALANTLNGLNLQKTKAQDAMDRAPGIRFNAPLAVDSSAAQNGDRPSDLPIYGKHVFLEIDFGAFDLAHLDTQADLPFDRLSRDENDQPQLGADAVRRLIESGDVKAKDLSLIDIRLFLNGSEVALSSLQRKGTRVSGTVPEGLLVGGMNHALLTITPSPALNSGKTVMHHVAFLRDADRMDRASNVITLDPDASVINTSGNDHRDAQGTSDTDRERIVIKNRSSTALLDLRDWALEDAYGHRFVFGRIKLLAGARVVVTVGRAPRQTDEHHWLVDYGYGPIALLNNDGERLLLRDPAGRIVSQLFTGSPKANPDIHFLAPRTAQ